MLSVELRLFRKDERNKHASAPQKPAYSLLPFPPPLPPCDFCCCASSAWLFLRPKLAKKFDTLEPAEGLEVALSAEEEGGAADFLDAPAAAAAEEAARAAAAEDVDEEDEEEDSLRGALRLLLLLGLSE